MNLFKSSRQSLFKFIDVEVIIKELMALLARWQVKKFKKSKRIFELFKKIKGKSLFNFDNFETIIKQLTATVTGY